MSIRSALFAALGILTALFAARWIASMRDGGARRPTPGELALGFVTNFFDTLGIGSFAPTTSIFKLSRMVPDELIPGTLNVGDALPTVAEALIFIAIIQMDMKTLALMISASVLGAWLGAGIVASWPRRNIQIGMGLALAAAAVFFVMRNLGLFPQGSASLGLSGAPLLLGLLGNAVLGALMTLGIGLYAPCMILTSLLGMNPISAFPIMMGSCAFLMPVACFQFIAKRRFSPGPALGLALGGVPGVLLAAYVVKSLPLTMLRWLVACVVLYTASAMLRSAWNESAARSAGEITA